MFNPVALFRLDVLLPLFFITYTEWMLHCTANVFVIKRPHTHFTHELMGYKRRAVFGSSLNL